MTEFLVDIAGLSFTDIKIAINLLSTYHFKPSPLLPPLDSLILTDYNYIYVFTRLKEKKHFKTCDCIFDLKLVSNGKQIISYKDFTHFFNEFDN